MATDTTKPVPPELWPAGKWTTSPRVTMATSSGDVVFELAPNSAQYTVVNFLAYVNSGYYSNLVFHRVIPSFVVQGGGFNGSLVQKTPFYLPISLESDNGLKNTRGTIAMARTSDPNSATSQFFVNLVNNTDLDHSSSNDGYAVFGKVVSGMSVIDAIGKVATGDRGGMSDVPLKNVVIKSAVETTTGTIHNKTGLVSVGGIESGATWQFSTDKGAHWTKGTTTGSSAYRFKLTQGAYEANDILIRSTDKAGNVSNVGHTGASVVMFAGAAILGSATVNALRGTSGNDHIFGLAGNDTLNALGGNDFLDGGSGRDTMIGGVGNDTYIVRDTTDIVRETATGGLDLVKSFATTYTLADFVERGQIMSTTAATLVGNGQDNLLFAGVGNNTLNGGIGSDTVSYAFGVSGSQGVSIDLDNPLAQNTGGSGTDRFISIENITGTAFADNLAGNGNDNILNGAAGADTLAGDDGLDTLIGGAGIDTFVFDSALNEVTNVDTVTDFVSASDVFELHLDIFTALQSTDGKLDADNFVSGASAVATTADEHIILDTTTGSLYYDADGAGGAAHVEFARLTGAHVAVATDFNVVA